MAIVTMKIKVVGGSGGPLDNAVPVYLEKKGPDGGFIKVPPLDKQLMFENGTDLLTINPRQASADERNPFMSYKANGEINYIRVWLPNLAGKGEDYVLDGKPYPCFVEWTHLVETEGTDPTPPPSGATKKFKLVNYDFGTMVIEVQEV